MRKLSLTILIVTLLGLLAACSSSAASKPTAAPPTATKAPATATQTPSSAATEAPTTEAMSAATEESTTTAAAAGTLRTPEEAALAAAGGKKIGGTVTVLGVWGGSEQDSFLAMVKPFEDATGVKVEYTGSRDAAAVLATRVQGGNPPDIVNMPSPGQMVQYAQQSKLIDLSKVLDMSTYKEQYAPTWIDLATVNNQLAGIFIKASVKGLIWYDPKVWQEKGFEVPTTWDELMALSQKMAGSGTTPWCVALESGAASGWPGTDWLEDIVLRQAGEKVYNQWWQGEIAWTSPEIKQAWETWGQIVGDSNMVYGGANTMLTTNFGDVGNPLFTDPPSCYMAHQASFITDFFVKSNPNLKPVQDFDFFPFPPFDTTAPKSTEIAGDLMSMFNDTPQSEALIRYLTTPEAQAIWVQRGGAISPNQGVPLSDYPDELSRKAAELLTSSDVAVFDASDQMPQAMNQSFFKGILDYVQNPQNLDNVLQNLDSAQKDAYQNKGS